MGETVRYGTVNDSEYVVCKMYELPGRAAECRNRLPRNVDRDHDSVILQGRIWRSQLEYSCNQSSYVS